MAEGSVAADELRLLIERIERLEAEKKAIAEDVTDVYAEAKARGYDVKTMRTIVRLRKMETQARQEADALLETYRAALGMDDGYSAPAPRVSKVPTPLEEAIERANHGDLTGLAARIVEMGGTVVDGNLVLPLGEKAAAPTEEDLYAEALATVIHDNSASTSYLQRKLRIGFNRAVALIERLEREGVVSAPDAQGKRNVLADRRPLREQVGDVLEKVVDQVNAGALGKRVTATLHRDVKVGKAA